MKEAVEVVPSTLTAAPAVVCHEADANQHNYIEDEGRPFEVAVQAEISNY
ncbi:hypothetical protein [Leptospira noguchii]|nr:hypothetical protein [Leptospira noguchii]